eukprot:SAG25_NODE_376_length_8856_cov_9.128354_3_plen_280_part_00
MNREGLPARLPAQSPAGGGGCARHALPARRVVQSPSVGCPHGRRPCWRWASMFCRGKPGSGRRQRAQRRSSMQQQHRENRYHLPAGFADKKFLECSIGVTECGARAARPARGALPPVLMAGLIISGGATTCAAALMLVCCTITMSAGGRWGAEALNNGVGRTPGMGWNWDYCTSGCTPGVSAKTRSPLAGEVFVRHIARFLNASGLQAKGYRYVNTDSFWGLGQVPAIGPCVWRRRGGGTGGERGVNKRRPNSENTIKTESWVSRSNHRRMMCVAPGRY